MKKCPKCGKPVDEDMIICPSCAERLQDPKSQTKTEFINIHLVRWLLSLALALPIVGFVLAVSFKNKYPIISKSLTKFSTFGVALLAMLFILGIVCYIAMMLTGVAFL